MSLGPDSEVNNTSGLAAGPVMQRLSVMLMLWVRMLCTWHHYLLCLLCCVSLPQPHSQLQQYSSQECLLHLGLLYWYMHTRYTL